MAEEAAEREESNLALIGNTVAGIGASFIPFGNIAYSVGRLFYSMNENAEGHQKRIDALTFSQLNQNYLRQHTIEPGSNYSGILKIGFEKDLEKGDGIIFRVSAENETEEFNFTCNESTLSSE